MANSISHITAADIVSTTTTGLASQTLVKGTPTTGSYVSMIIPDCSSINVTLFGTWSATLVAEQSSSNGDTWTGIGMLAVGTTTTLTTITGNGALSCNIAAATNFRIRCPSGDFTSGSVGVNIVASYAIGSVSGSGSGGGTSGGIYTVSPRTFTDQQTGTLSMDSAGNLIADLEKLDPVNDTVSVVSVAGFSAGAPANSTIYRTISLLATTGQNVKNASGFVKWIVATNQNLTTARYLKLYNKATTPAFGDTPIMTFVLPVGIATGIFQFPQDGAWFGTGIGMRATAAIADNDNTDPSANDVVVNMLVF